MERNIVELLLPCLGSDVIKWGKEGKRYMINVFDNGELCPRVYDTSSDLWRGLRGFSQDRHCVSRKV